MTFYWIIWGPHYEYTNQVILLCLILLKIFFSSFKWLCLFLFLVKKHSNNLNYLDRFNRFLNRHFTLWNRLCKSVKSWPTVKDGIGNQGEEWGNDRNAGNQDGNDGNAGSKGGNAGNLGGNAGSRGGNAGNIMEIESL